MLVSSDELTKGRNKVWKIEQQLLVEFLSAIIREHLHVCVAHPLKIDSGDENSVYIEEPPYALRELGVDRNETLACTTTVLEVSQSMGLPSSKPGPHQVHTGCLATRDIPQEIRHVP